MSQRANIPVVGVVANHLVDDDVHRNWLRYKYIDALRDFAKLEPVLLPTVSAPKPHCHALTRLDGLVLTRDESNIDQTTFERGSGTDPHYVHLQKDRYRDWAAYTVIATALDFGLPVLGICRGLQELALFFGGQVQPELAKAHEFMDYQEDLSLPRDRQYDPSHTITLSPDGILKQLLGRDRIMINSLHTQGVVSVPTALRVEALADDTLIEAASVRNSSVMQLAVQWHPEWHVAEDVFAQRLFERFGNDCDKFKQQNAA